MVHKHQSKSSSRIADRTRALIRVHGTVPALPSGGQARPAASERCEHGLFCAHACRKKCSGVRGDHGGIARAGGPGQRAMVRPHEALRCRSCRSKISAGTYLCNFACRKTRWQPITLPPFNHEVDLGLVYGQAKLHTKLHKKGERTGMRPKMSANSAEHPHSDGFFAGHASLRVYLRVPMRQRASSGRRKKAMGSLRHRPPIRRGT